MKLFVMYCSKSSIDPVLSGKYPHNIITHNAGNVYTRSENKKSRFCGREIPFSSGIRNTVTDPAGSVFTPFRVCFFRTFSLFSHCRRTYTSVSYDFLTVIAFLAVLAAVCAVSAAETTVCFGFLTHMTFRSTDARSYGTRNPETHHRQYGFCSGHKTHIPKPPFRTRGM